MSPVYDLNDPAERLRWVLDAANIDHRKGRVAFIRREYGDAEAAHIKEQLQTIHSERTAA